MSNATPIGEPAFWLLTSSNVLGGLASEGNGRLQRRARQTPVRQRDGANAASRPLRHLASIRQSISRSLSGPGSLSATAESSPSLFESAHGNWLSEKADDVRSVFRNVGLLVGQMLIPEFSGRRLQFVDPRR
jgi:hypothetical protein